MESLSEGDRRYLRDLQRSGVTADQIRQGIALGRARKAMSANPDPVRSLRYYDSTIHEGKTVPSRYLDYVEDWLNRNVG